MIPAAVASVLASHNIGPATAEVFDLRWDAEFLIVPFFCKSSELQVEVRRRLDGKKFDNGHKYLWTKNLYWQVTHIFGLDRLAPDTENCIVVEGFFDVMRLYDAGYRNVVASNGSRLSYVHWGLLKGFRRVMHVPDHDFPGWTGARASLEESKAEVRFPPHGKDPDQMTDRELVALLGAPPFGSFANE